MPTTFILLLMSTLSLLQRYGNCSNNSSVPNNKKTIGIGVLLTYPKDKFGFYRAVLLAKQAIENSPNFKHFNDKYQLKLIPRFDINEASITIRNAYEVSTNDKPLAFIGPTNSDHVIYAAKTLDMDKFLMVTVVSAVTDQKTNLRVLSSSTGIDQEVQARIEFLKKFKWKRAAFVYSLQKSNAMTYLDKMLDSFKMNDINLIGSAGIEVRKNKLQNNLKVLSSKLEVLKKNDTKIFIAEIDEYEALVVFCEVYKLKMYGEDIVWIISSRAKLLSIWMVYNVSSHQIVTCSKENLQEVINGSWIFQRQLIREDNVKTDSGLTPNEYMDKLINTTIPGKSFSLNRENLLRSALGFDALWGVATALNNSMSRLEAKNVSMSMNQSFTPRRELQRTLYDEMKKVDFQGVAGPYSYSTSINKDGTVKVMHYEDGGTRLAKVGEFDVKADNLTFINDTKYLWGPAGIPKDRSTIVKVELTVDRGLFIAIATLASIGIFLGIMFLTFNLVYGKYKFIKLSAPLFNNIIACGCILCLVSVFLFGVHDIENPKESFALVCKARAWTLTIGFSCAFGAMFVKTWRIYKICTNKKLRMKLGPLSNWYLLSLIGAIVLVDLVILITWELVDPLIHGEQVVRAKVPDPETRFKYYKEVLNVCKANHMVVWLTVIYVYKGILILYGLFLAYETRNVIYAHLNDSRVIGICVYNVVVLSVVGAFLSLLLEDKNYKEMYIVLAVCITFPAVATICLMMFPKIAYRCKTDNLDDTETIANGMTTVRNSFDVSTMNAPQIHVTTHIPQELSNAPQPSSSNVDAKFSYHKEVSADSNGGSDISQNGDVKQ